MSAANDNTWIFSGYPGHFIGAASCLFHLTTFVNGGTWMISTVGDYQPVHSNANKMTALSGYGESFFETMVFPTKVDPSSALPVVSDWEEQESRWYSTYTDATNGHIELCNKYHSFLRKI